MINLYKLNQLLEHIADENKLALCENVSFQKVCGFEPFVDDDVNAVGLKSILDKQIMFPNCVISDGTDFKVKLISEDGEVKEFYVCELFPGRNAVVIMEGNYFRGVAPLLTDHREFSNFINFMETVNTAKVPWLRMVVNMEKLATFLYNCSQN